MFDWRSRSAPDDRPLTGVRVLELGQVIAGPFAGSLLAGQGADVLKVEPPQGDPVRTWRVVEDGNSLWWHSLNRDKHITRADLKEESGQSLVVRLVRNADVLIENFRPGTLEKWSLGPDVLWHENPRLIIGRVSGFGQTGPYAHRPGFAAVCEAMAGLRHLTGFEGGPPVRTNLSLGDSLAGLFCAYGVMLALYERDRPGGTGRGRVVDTAITEAVMSMLESVVPEADRGHVRGPSGTTITGIVPSGTYRSSDGRWISIGANSEGLFRSLCRAMARPDLSDDPELKSNVGRVHQADRVNRAVAEWVAAHDASTVTDRLEAEGVPFGPVYTARDILNDPHYRARGVIETIDVNGRSLSVTRLAPVLGARAPVSNDD